jgi:uncharacterized protein YndB with AHSA1/START domain
MPPVDHELHYETHLEAPASRVFAALTEGRHLAEWFCDEAETEPEAQGRIVMKWSRPGPMSPPYEGRWVEFDAPLACAYEGGHEGYPDRYAGRVRYTLEPVGEGTLLTTRHTLPARLEYDRFAELYRDVWPRALARLIGYLSPEF